MSHFGKDKERRVAQSLLIIVFSYLMIFLLIPLGFVFYKSLHEYRFNSQLVHVALLDEQNEVIDSRSLSDFSQEATNVAERAANEMSFVPLVQLIPKNVRKDAVQYKIIDESPNGGGLQFDNRFTQAHETLVVPKARLKEVKLRAERKIGINNYVTYFTSPLLREAIFNSIVVALIVAAIVVPIAFMLAYTFSRTRLRGKNVFRLIAILPILSPSLLPAIGLIYLFGNQGIFKGWLMGMSVYGPIGIVLASVFFTLPHATLILLVALSSADQRLYDASTVLGSSKLRQFLTITLPSAKYALVSATFVVITLVITDFGVPKVIGGQFNMLALDIYKQVIGQQNFSMGAVISIVLLLPSVVAFGVEQWMQRHQISFISAQAKPLVIGRDRVRDGVCLVICSLVSIFLVMIILICHLAAFAKFWPYDLSLNWVHFDFSHVDGGGWASYYNSLILAFNVSTFGVILVFLGSYLVEKNLKASALKKVIKFLAMIPMAIPGMVMGLAYIFFFNQARNPLHVIYGTMLILVLNTITHLYTVPHLTMLTAFKQTDKEIELVAQSLRQPFWRTLWRVYLPVNLSAITEIWSYFFVNAMTTVSAVVFLYSPTTTLASISILNMDDAGDVAWAAAMALLIFYTNIAIRGLRSIVMMISMRTQAWRTVGAKYGTV